MKIAVIGSRNAWVDDLSPYLPYETTEIVSGGAKGIDAGAKEYAIQHNIPYTEFLPDYHRYRRGAPLRRNLEIIAYSDFVLAFWDGQSKGTKFVIEQCQKQNVPIQIIHIENPLA